MFLALERIIGGSEALVMRVEGPFTGQFVSPNRARYEMRSILPNSLSCGTHLCGSEVLVM